MRKLLAFLALVAAASPASAHPHVFVTARAELVFAPDGRLAAIRHRWTFDEGYSTFAVEGLDTDRDGRFSVEELAGLARTSTTSLADFGYFTHLKASGAKQPMGEPRDERMSVEAGRLTLQFDLPLKAPAANRLLVLDVYDPTFFVEFRPAEGADAVTLQAAPAGCAITRPKPAPPPVEARNLSESFFQQLTAASTFGSQFSNRAMVACP